MNSLKDRFCLPLLALLLVGILITGCRFGGPDKTRIDIQPTSPTQIAAPGAYELGLGGWKLVNRDVLWRDGWLYIPSAARGGTPLPLLVWLHGGGGNAESYQFLYPIADEFGIAILALDSRHNTWDGIDSPFGPDIEFIEQALKFTFDRVSVDAQRLAIGGLSDGGAYALAVGRMNGDLFSHIVAVAPGHLKPPAPSIGKPEIFLAHGRRDNVYSIEGSRRYLAPSLRRVGYDVTFFEFDGPHWVPEPVAKVIFDWIRRK